jgi:enoyl-CoA hydratase
MLQRSAGPQAAAAMVLFGEVLTGEEAAACGLAWRCVPDDELLDTAIALARRTADAPRELVRRTKATIADTATIADHPAAVERELVDQVWSVGQPAFQERLRSLQRKISGGS